jgi:RNA polymerase sigma-70 factor (ECF subfamily)
LTEAECERRRRFDALFREQAAGIASYCRWRSRSPGDAEDAVAEVFLIAWRRLDDVPAGDGARPWLYATARRVMANQARGNARRSRLQERLSSQAVAAQADEGPAILRVHEALAALSLRDREVLLLAEWEGLTPAEIGRAMHRPPVTVRVSLHRARRRFRVAWESRAAIPETSARGSISPLPGRRGL